MQGDVANQSVRRALSNASQFVQAKEDYPLDIIVEFDIRDSSKRCDAVRMYLGTRLAPQKQAHMSQVTHFIALASPDRLISKLHIDFDFDVTAGEAKPSPHFQGGGRVPTGLPIAYPHAPLWDTNLDKPRLPSLPFCTPLLWHLAFLEFQECGEIAVLLKLAWWQKLVCGAEERLWQPFFADGQTLIKRSKCVLDALYHPIGR
jgi:hypothetical protein